MKKLSNIEAELKKDITYKEKHVIRVYELPHELPNDLRLRILEN